MSEIERALDRVADDLSWLSPPPVFLGGATIGLFLDDFGRSQLRSTKDVDCIVPEVVSQRGWWQLEEALRAKGWSPDPDGPICRYRSPSGILVDIMTEEPSVMGFSGKWYPLAVQTAQRRILVTGRQVAVPIPSLLLACKLEAWSDRGRGDPLLSQDLEDIAALLDGCVDLEESVLEAREDVRSWLGAMFDEILEAEEQLEALLAHLPVGNDRAVREARVLALVRRLAEPGTESR